MKHSLRTHTHFQKRHNHKLYSHTTPARCSATSRHLATFEGRMRPFGPPANQIRCTEQAAQQLDQSQRVEDPDAPPPAASEPQRPIHSAWRSAAPRRFVPLRVRDVAAAVASRQAAAALRLGCDRGAAERTDSNPHRGTNREKRDRSGFSRKCLS